MKNNIAHKLEMPEGPPKRIGIVAHCEKDPDLIYSVSGRYKEPDPLDAALLRYDYKHTPNGVY